MSAIGGILRLDGQAVTSTELQRMQQALQAHGPDRQKIWHKGPVGLVSCLMRFTPEDSLERQPVQDKQQDFVMVFEGRLDDRANLARALDIADKQLKLMSDSQLVLAAYVQWGVDAFARIYGEYTLAIWHTKSQQLMLIRDPLGYHHSVFYTQAKGLFAFATTMPALQTLPEVSRDINEAKLADFLVLNHNELHTTLNQDIYRLPPAQCLQIDLGRRQPVIKTYWEFDLQREIRYPRDEDYVTHFNALFDQVVADNLRSSHAVGAFMSGGIDSSATATTAARQLKQSDQSLSTYTAVPQSTFKGQRPHGRYNDETTLVRAIAARHENLQAHFIDSADKTPLDGLEHYFMHHSAPFRNPCNRVWMENIMQIAAARGERVLLTGQHGNMSISYDGSFTLPEWLLRGRWIKLYWGLRHLHGYREVSAWRWLKRWGILPALPDRLFKWYRRLRMRHQQAWTINAGIRAEFAREQNVVERARAVGFDMDYRLPRNGRAARWEVLQGIDYSGDLHAGWRAAYGVDLRDPTSDRRIIEFCLAIPDEQYLNKKGMRWLAQRAFANHLPAEVLNNRLCGAQDPGWYLRMQGLREELRAEVQRLEKSDLARRALNLPRLKKMLDDWPAEDADWNARETQGLYRQCLLRGIMVGRYIRWFEGENR